jgi:DNA-binding NarL/FixJ family response regulator
MDVTMRELNGIDATRQLLAEVPGTHVVALSMHSDQRSVSMMLGAGASGYVLKDTPFDELVKAIRAASEGRIFLSERVANVVVTDYVARLSRSSNPPASGKQLSPREREVLQLIAEGVSTKEIAARLFLSVKTVETHRRQIMKKLDIYNVAGLIRYAAREGLISFED